MNREAGGGKGAKLFESIRHHSLFTEKRCMSYFTEYEGHAEKLIQQIVTLYYRKIRCVFIIGGDGTVHEVYNGLLQHRAVPICVLPAGSGNDFARGLGYNDSPISMMENVMKMPEGASFKGGRYETAHTKRHFVNNIGIGIDGALIHSTPKTLKKWLNKRGLGVVTYALTFYKAIRTFSPFSCTITTDGHTRSLEDCWLVVIGNHPYFGGGMRILPDARASSSLLSVLTVSNMPKWKIVVLFLSVFLGRHTQINGVELWRGNEIEVNCQSDVVGQVDGLPITMKRYTAKKAQDDQVLYKSTKK
ncbi:diacylglycerol/lipid kinase family protein [Pontibacillus halophilus]|uniref:diacylglycerol/lipid kinase family protein n=1 Tax=Pontibacillus halophilus TaxID=516704 RepID=UPI0018CD5B66|nr:diacylglycerol kinase family protein [Pontibacillus halophilus]